MPFVTAIVSVMLSLSSLKRLEAVLLAPGSDQTSDWDESWMKITQDSQYTSRERGVNKTLSFAYSIHSESCWVFLAALVGMADLSTCLSWTQTLQLQDNAQNNRLKHDKEVTSLQSCSPTHLSNLNAAFFYITFTKTYRQRSFAIE